MASINLHNHPAEIATRNSLKGKRELLALAVALALHLALLCAMPQLAMPGPQRPGRLEVRLALPAAVKLQAPAVVQQPAAALLQAQPPAVQQAQSKPAARPAASAAPAAKTAAAQPAVAAPHVLSVPGGAAGSGAAVPSGAGSPGSGGNALDGVGGGPAGQADGGAGVQGQPGGGGAAPVAAPALPKAAPPPAPKPQPAIDTKALLASYAGRVKSAILRHKQYPALAERLGHEGAVKVSFVLDAAGGLSSATVSNSSGYDELDAAALDAVQAAAPFDEFPAGVDQHTLKLSVTLKFALGAG